MASVLDAVIVGYWVVRARVDAEYADLDEAMRARAAATIAVDGLWLWLRPEQRAEFEGKRDVMIEALVERVLAGEAVTDPATAV